MKEDCFGDVNQVDCVNNTCTTTVKKGDVCTNVGPNPGHAFCPIGTYCAPDPDTPEQNICTEVKTNKENCTGSNQ